MQVEVKLRLLNSKAHQSLSSLLSPFLHETHFHRTIFFDGAASELSSRHVILRIRFYGKDLANNCVVCLKSKAVIVDGIDRFEEEMDPSVGRAIWAEPNRIKLVESGVLERLRQEFGVKDGENVCLGGFKNVRGVYEWHGIKMVVDETFFDFGSLYEVKCEDADESERGRELIEGLLKEHGFPYSYSKMSKFSILQSGKLPPVMNLMGGNAVSVSSNDTMSKPLWRYVTKLQKFGGGGNISFRCNYCQATYKGSYSRVKAHLLKISGHGIKQCPKVTAEHLKEMQNLVEDKELQMKKAAPWTCLLPPPPSSQSSSSSAKRGIDNIGSPRQELIGVKNRRTTGNLDLEKAFDERAKEHLDGEVSRMFFSAGLPFNLAENPYYKSAFTFAANNDIAGYVPPDRSYLTKDLLRKERIIVERSLEPIKGTWREKGVTVVCSGWTNSKRSLVEFMAVTDRPVFLKAVSYGAERDDKIMIFTWIEDAIMEVGPTNVVQVITENALICKEVGSMVEEAHPHIFWTPCMAHSLDLALGNIYHPKNTKDNEITYRECCWIIESLAYVKMVKNFIVNYTLRLSLFIDLSNLKLLALSKTHLASDFLLLKRFMGMKNDLRSMVVNKKWPKFCEGIGNAQFVKEKLLDDSLWEKIHYILAFTEPIYDMLKFVNAGRPCLHLMYEMWGSMMDRVKAAVYNHGKKEANEDSVFLNVLHRVLEDSWTRSKSPLYGLAHTLNPRYSCKQWLSEDPSRVPPYRDPEISTMRKVCFKRYFPDEEDRRNVNVELCKFFEISGTVSDEDSSRDRLELDAMSWWLIHGAPTPLLQKVAIRLLGQLSSSWCSEQTRGSSSSVHNVNDQVSSEQHEDLLFVHMNLRLLSKTPQDMER